MFQLQHRKLAAARVHEHWLRTALMHTLQVEIQEDRLGVLVFRNTGLDRIDRMVGREKRLWLSRL